MSAAHFTATASRLILAECSALLRQDGYWPTLQPGKKSTKLMGSAGMSKSKAAKQAKKAARARKKKEDEEARRKKKYQDAQAGASFPVQGTVAVGSAEARKRQHQQVRRR